MNARTRLLVILLGAIALGGAVLVRRHARGAMGKEVPGGILIGDAALYDALSHRFLLGSLFGSIAADIAATTPDGARGGVRPRSPVYPLGQPVRPRRDRPRP
jgi:hypothetical protein